MSLLLDALKKAAEDKKKASSNTVSSVNISADAVEKSGIVSKAADNLSLEEIKNSESAALVTEVVTEKISNEELTLDVEPVTAESTNPIVNDADQKATSQKVTSQKETNFNDVGIKDARHTVSDDALSLLIYKTNSEEKKRKRIFAIGSTIAILLVVGIGGGYYYLSFQEGINNLELKHRTSMMRMEAKTNKQQPPEKTEIIDNLTANSDIKIEKKTTIIVVDEVEEEKPLLKKKIRSTERTRLAQSKTRLLLIEKTKQADMIGKKLEAAWSDYENGSYAEAKSLYQEVILVEKSNRDALLGLGAIAVIEKDVVSAKEYYRSLLKLDPNDPLAVAALANLRSDEASPEISEKYLVSMLEKAPEAAQLNFELGNVYAKQNNWSAAQQSYFKAWQQESENPDYIFNLAVSLDQLGQQQQAMSFYKDSLLKAKNKQVSFSREIVEQRVTELSGL